MKAPKTISRSLVVLFVATILATGCSNEKDGFSYRTYHNTTTRFNGLFNAKESMREAQFKLFEAHEENWDEVLPVFIFGDETARQSIYPEMERVIEKCGKVITKHTIDVSDRKAKETKRPELNKWIDDSYLLLGQAYFFKGEFFKAEEYIKYGVKKYDSPQMQTLGNAWYARIYMERDQWKKAKEMLEKAVDEPKAEPEDRAVAYMTYAEYHIRQEDYKAAIEPLEKALEFLEKKKDRARPLFVLAQLNQKLGKSQDAIAHYKAVVKCKPYYEMEFYARINQALAFSRRGGSPQEIRETLFKMLKDDKNTEYRDQIYYALADLDLEERDREGGIDNLNKSLRANVDNTKQKVKSYLRLADLYFDERQYEPAQAYYDSTFQTIPTEHPRYQDVKNKATSLNELVGHLQVIYREDSLQALCSLGPEALEAKLAEVQQQIEDEIRAAREKAEREAQAALEAEQAENGNSGATFWPYNAVLRNTGYDNYIDYWGDRELEDNWRRKNKGFEAFGSGNEEEGEVEESVEEEATTDNSDEAPSIEELRKDLPCGEEAMAASNEAMAEAYYESGVVYKEKLADDDNAIESWQDMANRLDDSGFHPVAFYRLYRTFLLREQEGELNPFAAEREKSSYWARLIKERYPTSIYASLIDNPNFQDEAEKQKARELQAYEDLYMKYTRKQYLPVIQETKAVIDNEPENHLLCKHRFLRAVCIGNMDRMTGQRQNYIDALREITEVCGGSEEAIRAEELLQQLGDESGTSDVVPEPEEVKPEVPEDSPFTYDERAQHYFALVFNMDRANINQVKSTIADFNKKYFNSSNLVTAANLLGREKHIVLVKSFNQLPEGKSYLSTFANNKEELKAYNESGFETYLISKANYLQLFKTKDLDGYRVFFEVNYP